MIGFPAPREEQAKHYDFIRKQTHDADSQEWEFPAQYMFKGVPHYDRVDDPVDMLDRQDGPARHHARRSPACRPTATRRSRSSATPTGSSRRATSTRTRAWTRCASSTTAVRVHGAKAAQLLGHRPHPAGAAERQEDVPDLCEVHRARHPDLRVRRRARAAHPLSRRSTPACSTRCAGSSPSCAS